MEDIIEIPKNTGKPFLKIVQILSEEHYSGPYDAGKNIYEFRPTDERKNIILVNPMEGIMRSLGNRERFSSIKNTIEEIFQNETF